MALDRDLAVALVRAWSRSRGRLRSGWEMTAATGARGLRLLAEAESFESMVLTEANPIAGEVLRQNARPLPGARVELADARHVPESAPFDYVDLDPYGTPVPFLDSALSAVRPGGLLAVTATDLAVLAGAQPEACVRRYDARPVRGRLGPEGGLRILLGTIARRAQTRGRGVRSVFSYVLGHHVRAVVEVEGPAVDDLPVAPIDSERWTGPPLGTRETVGPLWLGALFDASLVGTIVSPPGAADPSGVTSFLARVVEESSLSVPFYYESNVLAKALELPRPPSREVLLAALRTAGFRAARTHVRPEGIRTDAPRTSVERIVRSLEAGRQSQNARVRA
jgi:tRNA (guanine26-N2/guanine27-N2)-dimethyltransferase